MVANGALALTGLNAAVIALSPAKAGEIYEVSLSGADEAIVKYMGLTLLGQAMMIYYSMQGESAATAIGYSILPQLIGNLQGNLNDEPGKLFGQEGPAKYINIVLAAFMAHTLLGSPLPLPQVDSGTAINAYAAWGALNGVGMYFATDKLMEAWGASSAKLQDVPQGVRRLPHDLVAHDVHAQLGRGRDQDPRLRHRRDARHDGRRQLHLEGRAGLGGVAAVLDGDQRRHRRLHPLLEAPRPVTRPDEVAPRDP